MAGKKTVGLICGKRKNILNISLWRKFKKQTGLDIEFRDFITIVVESNNLIKETILNSILGFNLPEGLGVLVITKYKPKNTVRLYDYIKSKKVGRLVYKSPFENNGYFTRLIWYKNKISKVKHIGEYKFIPDRDFLLKKHALVKKGKVYNEWHIDHFRVKTNREQLEDILYGK